jgi:hypothetical protein
MDQQGGSKPSFNVASVALASKFLLIGGILLLVDTFLPWQSVCASYLTTKICFNVKATSGNGGIFGVLMLILLLVLLVSEVVQLANMQVSMPIAPSKASAYLGFAVVVTGVLKFLLSAFNYGAWGAWVGLVLLIVIGYGSFLRFQEPEAPAASAGGGASPAPPAPPAPPIS